VSGYKRGAIESALEDLARASITVYRKHIQAWAVYAGSDFDIEAAVHIAQREHTTSIDQHLERIAVLHPLTARRHYSETGTMRCFELVVTTPEGAAQLESQPVHSRLGRFILVVPGEETSYEQLEHVATTLAAESNNPLHLFGVPQRHHRLTEYSSELAALKYVSATTPSLQDDSVARREINARIQHLRSVLEGELRDAFANSTWYNSTHTFRAEPNEGLSSVATKVCNAVFPEAPKVFSELANRDVLSSSAAKAQRLLMYRMLTHGEIKDLGFTKYPAEAGLFFTILAPLGLHHTVGGKGVFATPESAVSAPAAASALPLWNRFRAELESALRPVSLTTLYEIAQQPPFGVKRGLLPILTLAFFLAYRNEIAMYVEQTFNPNLTEVDIDHWLQDPAQISWKWVQLDTSSQDMLERLAECLERTSHHPVAADPLDSARVLVSMMFNLPPWTQHTNRISERSRKLRTQLLQASDPVKVIFTDLPEILGTGQDAGALVCEIECVVKELIDAYPSALRTLGNKLLESIDHAGPLTELQLRARTVQGISGNLMLDAFASRLTTYTGSDADIQSLISLAVSKPPSEFGDSDFDRATIQLAQWAFEFRRVETVASVQGRPATRRALAVVFGSENTISRTIDVAETDAPVIEKVRDELLEHLRTGVVKPDLFIAALAEAGVVALRQVQSEVAE
jgi:hypothetical protein